MKGKKFWAWLVVLAMVVCLIPSAKPVSAAATRFEAEDADYGTNTLQNGDYYAGLSGGAAIGMGAQWSDRLAEGDATGYVPITETVTVETAGTYLLTVAYTCGGPVDLQYKVNDGAWSYYNESDPTTRVLPASEGYNIATTATAVIELVAGENTISLTGPIVEWNYNWTAVYEGVWGNVSGANIDYFEIEEYTEPETIPDAVGTHEAENATQVNFTKTPEVGSYYSSCSGSGIVGVSAGWINNAKKHISQKVNATKAGKYNLVLQYCAPKAVEFMISVNSDSNWTCFDEVADVTGHVSPSTGGWNAVGTVSTVIELVEGENTINISGPIVDNATSDGNFFTVYESSWSNSTSANLDCFIISEYTEPEVSTYSVKVDGTEVAQVEEGATYTLGDVATGYICGDKAYKPGTEVTVNADMEFISIGDVSITAAQGAGIRYVDSAGIRFQATINAKTEVLNSAAPVTTGMIITAKDIYDVNGSVLTLDAIADKNEYAAINVVNNGWYEGQVGTYCASIVNIPESNYIRNFIAVAYATITYTDGTTATVYSNMTGVRSIQGVATAVQAAGYAGIDAAYHSVIDAYAAAK